MSVRVPPGLRSFQVWLDRRDVTREFRRLGNRRVALLRPKVGVNRLYVRVRGSRGRRDFDYVRFVRVSRRGSLLQLGALRAGARGGRVPVKVLLRGKGLRLRAFLNGRRLRSTGSGGVRRFVLDGDDGLHFGRNRIRFAAFSERGAYDVERRSVRVGRDHPIPAAGGDRRVKVTQLVRLDARRSRAAKRSHTLGYRWRVVRKPKGSRATLRDAATALPWLRPDRPGDYLIRLALSDVLERLRRRRLQHRADAARDRVRGRVDGREAHGPAPEATGG